MSVAASLHRLLAGLAELPADTDPVVSGLSSDSRRVRPGHLFLAIRGRQHHGLDFLPAVLAAGAAAVAWEPPYRGELPPLEVPLVAVANLGRRLGLIGERFHGAPARQLQLVGITGTDGKTSCAHFLAQALHESSRRCAYLGTLGYGFPGEFIGTGLTTPDALQIQAALAALRGRGARAAAMEVSSHALDQGRTADLSFQVAVLTNLGRDHLDYHGTLEAYRAAKARLFLDYRPAVSVLNGDDDLGRRLLARLDPARTVGYGLGPPRGPRWVRGDILALDPDGLRCRVTSTWGEGVVQSSLLGQFNVLNLLAVLATLLVLEIPFEEALARLSRITTVPGRMERLQAPGRALAVVDYAHTPGALGQALAALRAHTRGKLWCVFGCGGDRDTGKRPAMGAIAETHADRVILTNDNPRTEDPAAIAAAILAGCRVPGNMPVILDRAAAIAEALGRAAPGDVVLIAGKGHEDYQVLGDRRVSFSDRDVVRQLWQEKAHGAV